MNHLEAPLIVAIIFFSTLALIKIITDYLLKQKLINAGHIDSKSIRILDSPSIGSKYSSLKWGLIALFAGIGLVVLEFVRYDYDSPFPFGVELICIALGFLFYYLLIRKEIQGKRSLEE